MLPHFGSMQPAMAEWREWLQHTVKRGLPKLPHLSTIDHLFALAEL